MAADYSELGLLLITAAIIGLVVPLLAIKFVRAASFKSVGDP